MHRPVGPVRVSRSGTDGGVHTEYGPVRAFIVMFGLVRRESPGGITVLGLELVLWCCAGLMRDTWTPNWVFDACYPRVKVMVNLTRSSKCQTSVAYRD